MDRKLSLPQKKKKKKSYRVLVCYFIVSRKLSDLILPTAFDFYKAMYLAISGTLSYAHLTKVMEYVLKKISMWVDSMLLFHVTR